MPRESPFWKNFLSVVALSVFVCLFFKNPNLDEEGDTTFENVIDGLQTIYSKKLLPLEQAYLFHEFHSPKLHDSDFKAKPSIMLMGQYSTGKTSFIKYLLKDEYPGMRIGPEPTTDRFIVVMHGSKEGIIPGNALVVDPEKQFRPLSKFGNNFLNRFQCSLLDNSVLKSMSIVDTPGILSGEKHRIDRGYDFTGVLEWFAERVDRIILLFDAHKLDISDEFRRAIEVLRSHDDKIRIVLNKADMVDHQQLMRVYGALMWSLGKIMPSPETARVYIGSFWDEPLKYDMHKRLFEDEEQDLFSDIQSLPKNAALWKLNELSRRARLAKVHAYIIGTLRSEMPRLYSKEAKKEELIRNLEKVYKTIQQKYHVSPGDFPDINKMKELLEEHDFSKFEHIQPKLFETVDNMLANDIPLLMAMILEEEDQQMLQPYIQGGIFNQMDFETRYGPEEEGIYNGYEDADWVVNKVRHKYDAIFKSLNTFMGKLKWSDAKDELMKTNLPHLVLTKIWKLSDIDHDGLLDADEFSLAMYLSTLKLKGYDLPPELPDHLIPPLKHDPVQPRHPNFIV